MKNFKPLLALASIVITGSLFISYYYMFESPGTAADLVAIEQVFNDFKQAAIDRDGHTAAALFDRSSMACAEKLQHLAVYATQDELDEASIADQLYAMMLRVQLKRQKLAEMTPEMVAAYLVASRTVGTFLENRSFIDGIAVRSRRATGKHMKHKWQVGDPLEFVMENGEWHLRLVPMIDEANHQIENLAGKDKDKQQEFVYRLVEVRHGTFLEKDHFLPVKGEL